MLQHDLLHSVLLAAFFSSIDVSIAKIKHFTCIFSRMLGYKSDKHYQYQVVYFGPLNKTSYNLSQTRYFSIMLFLFFNFISTVLLESLSLSARNAGHDLQEYNSGRNNFLLTGRNLEQDQTHVREPTC